MQRKTQSHIKQEKIPNARQLPSGTVVIDEETVKKHDDYIGKRIRRGLFRTKENIYINADVNGSYNILRKYLKVVKNTNIYDIVNLIEVCSTPSVFTISCEKPTPLGVGWIALYN